MNSSFPLPTFESIGRKCPIDPPLPEVQQQQRFHCSPEHTA